ncbi:MAG: N-acetyltransferase [Gemmatimonadaceae bacterium]|nr:N-acetyltransferase [Gemmatimonadaceae bacterium]
MTPDVPVIEDRPDRNRYELAVGDQVAFLEYRRRDDRMILVHVEVPESLRGSGLGSVLARHAFESARATATPVVVRCPYVTAWLRRHPEYNDLVVSRVSGAS